MSERVAAEVRVTLEDGHGRDELAVALGRALRALVADGAIRRGFSAGTRADDTRADDVNVCPTCEGCGYAMDKPWKGRRRNWMACPTCRNRADLPEPSFDPPLDDGSDLTEEDDR